MKKLMCVLVVLLILTSCGNDVETPKPTIEIDTNETSTPINNEEISDALLINMNVVHDINDINDRDGYGVVNHNYVDSFNYGIEIILENNQIKLVKQDQEKYLSSDNKIISLADVWNCGGEPRIFALDDCGKVYYVDYEEYNEAKLIDLNLNQKVINLAIFNDTTPFTTCGGDTIYVELEDHKYYRLNDYLSDKPHIGDLRENIHSYVEHILVVDYAIVENQQKATYIFFNEDGSAYLGYCEDYRKQIIEFEQDLLKDENGNTYHFNKMYGGPYDNILEQRTIYLIDENDAIYTITITSNTYEFPGIEYLGEVVEVNVDGKEYLKIVQE